jgi:hypothetical protein
MANGTLPENIVCPVGFVVIVKLSTNSPVCVTRDTMTRLIERQWGINPINSNGSAITLSLPYVTNVSNTNFTMSYAVTGATVTGIQMHEEKVSIIILLHSQRDGSITINLPRNLLDSGIHNRTSCDFFFLNDGMENDVTHELKTTSAYNTIEIPFVDGTKEIEVIRGCYTL